VRGREKCGSIVVCCLPLISSVVGAGAIIVSISFNHYKSTTAFRVTTVILAVLIFVSLPDCDEPDGFVLPPRGR
jgi:predicted small integral membrane protein